MTRPTLEDPGRRGNKVKLCFKVVDLIVEKKNNFYLIGGVISSKQMGQSGAGGGGGEAELGRS